MALLNVKSKIGFSKLLCNAHKHCEDTNDVMRIAIGRFHVRLNGLKLREFGKILAGYGISKPDGFAKEYELAI
ncbi:hypothetical protein ACLKA7_007378 [Drosophila subpalustris]